MKYKAKKPVYLRGWFILLVVIAVLVAVGKVRTQLRKLGEPFQWEDIRLSDVLPEPANDRGEVYTDTDSGLRLDVFKTSQKQYNDYVDACKEQGFTVDGEMDSFGYSAYNDDGYDLQLTYSSSDQIMGIELDPPREMDTIQWPANELGALIPAPQSTVGSVSWERANGFSIYVGQTDREAFDAYVTACAEAGFTVDYEKGDDHYRADDGVGHHLSLTYEGGGTMSVRLETVEEQAAPAEGDAGMSGGEQPEAETDTSTEGMRPEFKEMMDGYEAFFDEYIEFMQAYQQSDGNTVEMIAKYADFMSKYAQTMEQMDQVGEEEMSNEELLYYTEVTTRISQKLLSVAIN